MPSTPLPSLLRLSSTLTSSPGSPQRRTQRPPSATVTRSWAVAAAAAAPSAAIWGQQGEPPAARRPAAHSEGHRSRFVSMILLRRLPAQWWQAAGTRRWPRRAAANTGQRSEFPASAQRLPSPAFIAYQRAGGYIYMLESLTQVRR